MIRLMLILVVAATLALKLFTVRLVPADGGRHALYGGVWTGGVNRIDAPLPPGEPVLLASGEGGFALEPLYAAAMEAAWLIVAFAVVGILLLGILRPRYGVRY